ncbi:DUF4190 domain-containing protein [Streptomyces sp. NPDC049915]|uniref:DUF4190 domain-containing protein n=1 Tax=Streptomyces sp. NPDC049915 TaxID=3155510 RepID=UPI0034357C57
MSIPPPPPGPQQPSTTPGPYQAPPPQGPYAAPGGYPPPPYQPWGQGYTPFNRPAPVNGVAIAALVLGALCFLPAVGLVLGVIALVQIRKRGERGKGLAIGGAVLSTIGLALWVLALATGGVADFWQGMKDGARDSATFSLHKGQCFDEPGALGGATYDVDEVPCAGRHDGEVFGTFNLPAGSHYPGERAIDTAAESRCYPLADAYAMDSWAWPDDVDVYYFSPSKDSWALGDREVACVFGNTDEHGTLTGSLRADATTLDADQVAFLTAAQEVERALDDEPEDLAEDDLEGNRTWAREMKSALDRQISQLESYGWGAGHRQQVAAYVEELRAARGQWAKAASATDPDTFDAHYAAGFKAVDGAPAVAVRKALKLATTPPSDTYGDSGGTDSGGTGDSGDLGGSGGGGGLDV